MSIYNLGLSLIINTLLLILMAIFFGRKRPEPLAGSLFWVMIASAWSSFFYGLEFYVKDPQLLHYVIVLEFLGLSVLPVFWFIFTLRFNPFQNLKKFKVRWLFLIPVINFLIALTNPWHQLLYTKAEPAELHGLPFAKIDFGVVFYFVHIPYALLLILASLVILARVIISCTGLMRRKAIFLFLAAWIPFSFLLLSIAGVWLRGVLDITPFGITILGLVIIALYDDLTEEQVRPLVFERLFEEQLEPLIVIDTTNHQTVYSNLAGKNLVVDLEQTLGKTQTFSTLNHLTNLDPIKVKKRHYQARVKKLDKVVEGRNLKFMSFYDISRLKKQEENLGALTQLTSTFSNDIKENIGKLLAFLGKTFDASACFYNKKQGEMLVTEVAWNVPEDYQYIDKAEGHICTDVILMNRNEPVVINGLRHSSYQYTDPHVQKYGLETYFGSVIREENKANGTICVVYNHERAFDNEDQQLLEFASYIVANEEARHKQWQMQRETEINLRAILENARNSIWSVDTDFRITYINETFRHAFKIAFKTDLQKGSRILDHLPEPLQAVWETRFRRTLNGEHSVFFESVEADGKIYYFEVSMMPIHLDGRITGISFYARDFTKKYQSEQKLIENEKHLAKLNAAKDRLFSIISHDLRSPFNNIIGLSEIMADMAADANQAVLKQYAASINSVSRYTYNLLENLLHWSRTQSGHMTLNQAKLQLSEIVNQELEMVQHQIEKKIIQIKNKVSPSDMVMADAQSVAIIVRNLISNAIKFSHPEGEIVIFTEHEKQYVTLKVQDFGCGISSEDQKKLFKLDEHLSRRGTQNESGTGLGLILCKELAEKNNGYLLVKSILGKGSTFSLMLKRAEVETD